MLKTKKKSEYGEKATVVLEWLNKHPEKSNKFIASMACCAPSYVHHLRKRMAHLDDLMKDAVSEAVEANDVDAILNQRGSRYGSFVGHAGVTQAYKDFTALELRNRDKTLAPDQQEALDMIFHKIGRIINGDPDYADSWIDIAGYAKLVADRLEGKER